MAPSNFQIYVDAENNPPPPLAQQAVKKNVYVPPPGQHQQRRKFIVDELLPRVRFAFDIWKHYPIDGDELSIEEILLVKWTQQRHELALKQRIEELERENLELKQQISFLNVQMEQLIQQKPLPDSPQMKVGLGDGRFSIIPQSLQPTSEGMDISVSMCKDANDGTSVLHDLWRHTTAHQFTLPIDQSKYIKENVPTSTPNMKRQSTDDPRRNMLNNRRMSRPILGGSPTLKLSPITETSRDGNSKSSSSSSGMSATPSTVKKVPPLQYARDKEPDRVLDPNDPTSYYRLLRALSEPLENYPGLYQINTPLPRIEQEADFNVGSDLYMVGKQLSEDAPIFTAQLLNEDSNDSIMDAKTVCFRVDRPANEWLFYICSELHKRLAKLKSTPDIELSVMMTNPAFMYIDGSIMVDEFLRFVTLQDYLEACLESKRMFPKAVAAYLTVELIQVIRQMHACDVIHMNINPKNILLTCSPSRDDIESVDKRTSIVKLIGFDRAMDVRLLPNGFKFEGRLDDLVCCQMLDSAPWSHEVDWYGALDCIHKMFFLEGLKPTKTEDGRWTIDKHFKGFPTEIWASLFDELLNVQKEDTVSQMIDRASEELNTWVKANLGFVLKEASILDDIVEKFRNN